MSKPTVTILAEDLYALTDSRRALADLVHVLESEPNSLLTTGDLQEGYQVWRGDALARAQVALEVTEMVAILDAAADDGGVDGNIFRGSMKNPGVATPPQSARRLRVVDGEGQA